MPFHRAYPIYLVAVLQSWKRLTACGRAKLPAVIDRVVGELGETSSYHSSPPPWISKIVSGGM